MKNDPDFFEFVTHMGSLQVVVLNLNSFISNLGRLILFVF